MNVVEVRNLSKSFRGFELRDLSFDLKQGYITGFIGQNGSGKSTTIKLMMQLLHQDSGEIRIFGLDAAKDGQQIKERIGFVYDEGYFYEHLTVQEMKSIVAPFYRKWDDRQFHRYMKEFDLPAKRKIKHLSKGMKMKLSLAIALSHGADLIIMDEPTSGLDPIFRREILDILLEILQDQNKTIIFSTHITTDLEQVADYIIFLHQGRIQYQGGKDDMLERYVIVKGNPKALSTDLRKRLIGIRENSIGFEGLIDSASIPPSLGEQVMLQKPSLEDIMYLTIKGDGSIGSEAAGERNPYSKK